MIVENGPWKAGHDEGKPESVYVESADFTHDVRLYVTGDFTHAAEKLQYAQWLAQRLNQRD